MASISGITAPPAPWPTARTSRPPLPSAAGATPPPAIAAADPGQGPSQPVLSTSVQATLLENQAHSPTTMAPSQMAKTIEAADVLAQAIVSAADTNHNGTLSHAEMTAASAVTPGGFDGLDTTDDGQVSVGELAKGMLAGEAI